MVICGPVIVSGDVRQCYCEIFWNYRPKAVYLLLLVLLPDAQAHSEHTLSLQSLGQQYHNRAAHPSWSSSAYTFYVFVTFIQGQCCHHGVVLIV